MSPSDLLTNPGDLESIAYGVQATQLPRPLPASHRWFAVRVRSNFERTSALHLRQRGYQEFVPTYTTRSRWSDRVKCVTRPLFPGYVFCSFDPHRRLPVLASPGVLHILGVGREPLPIDQKEMESVWTMVSSGLLVKPWPYLEIGERVVIESGPLAGVEGTVTQFKGSYRLAVSVTLLQRSIAAEIERDWVRPLGKNAKPAPQHAM